MVRVAELLNDLLGLPLTQSALNVLEGKQPHIIKYFSIRFHCLLHITCREHSMACRSLSYGWGSEKDAN